MVQIKHPHAWIHVGVGITFEPDIGYGSSTYGMHVVTKIRPYSPAHKSKQRTDSTLPHPSRPEIYLLECLEFYVRVFPGTLQDIMFL